MQQGLLVLFQRPEEEQHCLLFVYKQQTVLFLFICIFGCLDPAATQTAAVAACTPGKTPTTTPPACPACQPADLQHGACCRVQPKDRHAPMYFARGSTPDGHADAASTPGRHSREHLSLGTLHRACSFTQLLACTCANAWRH
jgi:hypothetical protein